MNDAAEEFEKATTQSLEDIYPDAATELPQMFKQLSDFDLTEEGVLTINTTRTFAEQTAEMTQKYCVTENDKSSKQTDEQKEEARVNNKLVAPEKELIVLD